MDESLKNQVINSVKYTYLKELKNKHTGFLGVMFRNLLKHLINRYGKIVAVDLKSNNQWMNEPIESYQPIEKYFEWTENCIQY